MSENGQRLDGRMPNVGGMDARCKTGQTPPLMSGLYHGWRMVAAAFVIAVFGWGLGFYGPGIYLVALRARFGWSAADIAFAITGYYLLSASLTLFFLAPAFARCGPQRVIAAGMLAMGAGIAALALVSRLWHVYAAFAVMSIGCATMTGAAIPIVVAPWFDRRRGFAVSLALNGASFGGLVMAPLLIFLMDRFGFAAALWSVDALMFAVLLPLLAFAVRGKRADEHHWTDAPSSVGLAQRSREAAAPAWSPKAVLRDANFLTISIPFALGLTAQVGFLTHQVAFLMPMTGTVAAGWIVSLTTFAAIAGRLGTGLFVDRVDRRGVSCLNFLVQILAMAILMSTTSPALLIAGCVLFGLGLGNLVSLPGLIVQQEFPQRDFARVVSMIVAINQFAFAFGPALLGRLQQAEGAYTRALLVCLLMQAAAAVIVVLPIIGRMKRSR
jgi:MFS family permease